MNEPSKGEFQIPVLTRKKTGGYRDDLFLGAEYQLRDGDTPFSSIIDVTLSLDPCYLRDLVEKGKASIVLGLSQRSYRDSFPLLLDKVNTIQLDIRKLMPQGKIDLLPVIVADEDLDLPFIEGEMEPRYRYLNPPFHAKRGFILGYGESISFPLAGSSNISSFITISKMDEAEEKKVPFLLDLTGDQIEIKMRSGEYELWTRVCENNALYRDLSLVNAAIGFSAIYQVLLAVLNENERPHFRRKLWYASLISLLCKKTGLSEDVLLCASQGKEAREKAWTYTGIVLDGLMKESFEDLLNKGRVKK